MCVGKREKYKQEKYLGTEGVFVKRGKGRPEIDGNAELGWMSGKKHAEIR